MLTNKQKYDYYVKTYNRIERGWTKRTLGSGYGGACLVGAINFAVTGNEDGVRSYWDEDFSTKETPASNASKEMQFDLATEILPPKKRFLLSPKPITVAEVPPFTSPDGGLKIVENWNDDRARRKDEVLAVVQKRIDFYKPLVRDQEIERLKTEITNLKSQLADARERITVLEAEVEKLRNDNMLRRSRVNVTAAQLRDQSDDLRDLDDELNKKMAELQGWGLSSV